MNVSRENSRRLRVPVVSLLYFLLVSFAQLHHQFFGPIDHHVQYVDVNPQLVLLIGDVVRQSALLRHLRAQTVAH